MYVVAIFLFSLEKCLSSPLLIFSVGRFVHVLILKYILDIVLLSDLWLADVSLHSAGCLFMLWLCISCLELLRLSGRN